MSSNENEAVIRLAQTVGHPVATADGRPLYAALPHDVSIHDLERFLPDPRRQRGYTELHDTSSFSRFVAGEGSSKTKLFASKERNNFAAVFNPGTHDDPDFGDHGCHLTLEFSRQWKAWSTIHRNWSGQSAFAEFLQDHLEDVVEPAAADLLMVATNLQAKTKANFKSGINLHNGAIQFEYDEQVEAKGKGVIEVPETFVIGIPVYDGGAAYKLQVRLRWRISNEKQLLFRIDIANHNKVVEDAFGVELHKIEEATGLNAFMGESNGLTIG